MASCGHNDERAEFGAHEAVSDYEGDETNHWKNCATCGYDMSKEAHNYNKEVASSTYLKSAATIEYKAKDADDAAYTAPRTHRCGELFLYNFVA